MSAPGIDEKKETVADPEAITQHVETYNFIDEEEFKGDVDIAVVALRGQDLAFTEEGKFGAIFSMLVFWNLTLPEKRKVLRKIDWHILPLAAWSCGLQFVDKVYLRQRHKSCF
jgi:hypothetical protein